MSSWQNSAKAKALKTVIFTKRKEIDLLTFFEKELHRLFDDSERISDDTVFAGKTMITKIGEDLRAKVQFVNTKISGQYYETEDYYEDVGFGRADHERLCNALMKIKGKFLLSYNDCPEIRELYSREGLMIESTTRLSNIAQRYDAGKQYPELLISNYDTYEEGVLARQLTLFDDLEESEKILKEHRIIWKSNVK